MSGVPRDVRPVLLYDGDCGFCTACVSWMRRRIRRLPAIVPHQAADLPSLGVTEEACRTAVQWVGADGTVLPAQHAVARVLVDAGRGWRILGRTLQLPGVSSLAGVVYRLVARNRHRLPGAAGACAVVPRQPDGAGPVSGRASGAR